MKKVFAIFIAIAMAMSTSILVSAAEGDPTYCVPNPGEDCAWRDNYSLCNIVTEVTVAGGTTGGGNAEPVIKCKWEYDLDVSFLPEECAVCGPCITSECLETGYWTRDACPCEPGLDVLPILGGSVRVGYYAVVTDLEGISTLQHVYADVWHPDGEFKYQIELFPLEKVAGLNAFDKVTSCYPDLIEYNTDYFSGLVPGYEGVLVIPDEYDFDIEHELSQDLAEVYYGEALISYCQPGGYYTVGVRAHDNFNAWSDYLYNQFWYIPTTAINIDFTKVDYGNAVISNFQWASGDQDMQTNAFPTIQNWGNTPVDLYVWQDDMDFGTTIQNGVEYWNVEFDARLGSDGTIYYYEPFQNATGFKGNYFGYLDLCTLEKADFSIHVKKADPGNTYTGSMCLIGYRNGNPVWMTPTSFVGNAPGAVVQDIYDPDPSQAGPDGSST